MVLMYEPSVLWSTEVGRSVLFVRPWEMFGIASIPSMCAIMEELFIQMSLMGNFDMQKAPGLAETCESNYRCGFSCFSNVCST